MVPAFSFFTENSMACGINRAVMVAALLLAPACLLGLPRHAGAADTKGNFALHGVGAQTCQQFMDEVKKNNPATNELLLSWLAGYMTAANRYVPKTYDVVPAMAPGAYVEMVNNVCAKSPNDRVEAAIAALFRGLSPARITSDSPLIVVQSGQNKIQIRRETFISVQNALMKRKLYRDRPRNEMSRSLETALKAFQKEQNLKETGLPDAATVIRLLVVPAEERTR
jgi:hypothetical protein